MSTRKRATKTSQRRLDVCSDRDHVLHVAIDNSQEAFAFWGPDGRCEYMNDAHAKLFGLRSGKACVGKKFWNLVPHSKKEFQATTRRLKKQKQMDQVFTYGKGKTLRVISVRSTAIYEDKTYCGYTCQARDITTERLAKTKLKDSQNLLHALIRSLPDFTLLVDEKGKIVFINKVVPSLKEHKVIGSPVYHFVPASSHATVKAALKKVFTTGKKTSYETLGPGPGKKKSLYLSTVIPLRTNHHTELALIIARDITEQREAQAERRRLQDQLRKYAKELETKVHRLQKEKIDLKRREQLVLAALTEHPTSTDQQLAKRTHLKRSTVTTIRGRLRLAGWYKPIYLPNLSRLGLESISFIYVRKEIGQDKNVDRRFHNYFNRHHSCFLVIDSQEFIFALCAHRNLREADKEMEQALIGKDKNSFLHKLEYLRFYLPSTHLARMLDFAPLVGSTLNQPAPPTTGNNHKRVLLAPVPELKDNEKEVLYALLRRPLATNDELSRLTRLSKPTIIKTKRRLLDTGILRRATLPDLEKLKLVAGSLCFSVSATPGYTQSVPNKLMKDDTNSFLSILHKNKFLILSAHKDDKERNTYQLTKKNLFQDLFKTLSAPTFVTFNNPHVTKLDFAGLVKHVLGLDIAF